jgi:hypothetical protein
VTPNLSSSFQVAPKRAALKGAQDELAATMASLAEAQAKLQAVEEKINMLERQFAEATAKKEGLAKQVGGCCSDEGRGEKGRQALLRSSLPSSYPLSSSFRPSFPFSSFLLTLLLFLRSPTALSSCSAPTS